MKDFFLLVLCGVGFLALCIFFAQYFWRFVISYRVSEVGIEIRVLGLCCFKTRVENIVDVKHVPFAELLPWKNVQSAGWVRLGNRFWGGGILVSRNRGIFRKFVISPDDQAKFLQEVNACISRAKQKRVTR
jgi:hypothetical protein